VYWNVISSLVKNVNVLLSHLQKCTGKVKKLRENSFNSKKGYTDFLTGHINLDLDLSDKYVSLHLLSLQT
jgi:hypothetical protein